MADKKSSGMRFDKTEQPVFDGYVDEVVHQYSHGREDVEKRAKVREQNILRVSVEGQRMGCAIKEDGTILIGYYGTGEHLALSLEQQAEIFKKAKEFQRKCAENALTLAEKEARKMRDWEVLERAYEDLFNSGLA